ncbi:MAG: cold shock domain-containing protein [Chloroflexi bacterium]|nr:cold shock domain-containing protein [Chloroflexota bacterium]MBI3040596.1 cold shock domain-containing protein [Chloroflexota bacterium]
MQVPPEIVLKGVATTPYIDKLITRGIARLERVCDYIISMHIAVEQAQGRRQTGNPYRMRIDIRIPDRADVVVKRWSKASKKISDGLAQLETQLPLRDEVEPERSQPIGRSPVPMRGRREEPLRALIRRTFDSARRELEKVVDRQRGEVKGHPEQQAQAVVEKIFREQQYGFLGTLDGQQVYFHRNSVLHNHWGRLRVGTAVRYTLEMGDKGPQASTVEPVDKPGAAEIHDQLHDLPVVSRPLRSRRKTRGRMGE